MQIAGEMPRPKLHQPLRSFGFELLETALWIVMVYALVNLATVRFFIEGPSMQPSFYDEQFLIVSRAHYLLGEPQRGDIVVFDPPGDDHRADNPLLIKRLIGLPGETVSIRDGQVYINGQPLNETYTNGLCTVSSCRDSSWTLGANEFFMMGDNRNNSRDSRAFGVVDRSRIVGEAIFRYWPAQDVGIVTRHRFPAQSLAPAD